ncbi:hypothetical protein DY000_02048612 [Brassica cretica]|uniref:Uncharacterized protein n=1 Tax=Brassica cretica TaxID=69181 RepID=A0ABQ7F5D4_BRACR|nr:hypothetical protein DY000_02048612 [Brassica cretica]
MLSHAERPFVPGVRSFMKTAKTKGRSSKNRLSVIADKNGVPVYEEEEISRAISGYYSDLFESGCVDGQPKIVEALQPCISDAQNERLIVMPHANEIKEAAFAINADKVLGPDGVSAIFFQSNWRSSGQRW